jgi:hypothetical protein
MSTWSNDRSGENVSYQTRNETSFWSDPFPRSSLSGQTLHPTRPSISYQDNSRWPNTVPHSTACGYCYHIWSILLHNCPHPPLEWASFLAKIFMNSNFTDMMQVVLFNLRMWYKWPCVQRVQFISKQKCSWLGITHYGGVENSMSFCMTFPYM